MTDTLKFICEQCIHLHNPQLEFIPAQFPRYREIILRDLRELVSAASTELEKTVVILAGSILEAILYGFIQGQEEFIAGRRGTFTLNPKHGLQGFVNIFNRYFGNVYPGVQLPDIVVNYRDLIHFNNEINNVPDICVRGSREMLRILNNLIGELSQSSVLLLR
ncbi:MAG: hypothetical protein WBN92_06350 [Terriglobia bacterium]